ncbi:NAD(P)-dependent oxidoreductase [Noviherbaspirillum pedocola]|uniref:NAD(P)-dependent oxidoreductase n=1 Tax=Noviherbaspirillum pedocola TaxID=2801341 RepID=A0A934W9X9_9BURK|nr:NAD(P)-dependent oxidoreductase [Noviherbaspirillum pedocola]MBK4738853.1 NAD(P)-dependent oxidoreductase [Noviherbaspirillum pedocola]
MNQSSIIGVIGIGAMGMGIAKNLHKRGYTLAVRDIRPEAQQEAASLGMQECDSSAALGRLADVAIVVVVNAQQIDEVLFGEQGLAQLGAKTKTVLLCSTIAPEDSIRIAQRLAERGIAAIDAPISGGPAKAEAGTMSMMIAGETSLLATLEPLLSAMAEKRFVLGAVHGDAAKAKLVNNLLAGINLVAGAEALALGMKIGLDANQIFDIIRASSGNSWVFEDRMARALRDDYAPRAFAHILTKDVTLATGMAHAAGYATPLGDAALRKYRETLERGWSELDDAAVLKTYLERG